jgi:hypothetical protein
LECELSAQIHEELAESVAAKAARNLRERMAPARLKAKRLGEDRFKANHA